MSLLRPPGPASLAVKFPDYGDASFFELSYPQAREYVRRSVLEERAPSQELIIANYILAIWEAHHNIGEVSSFPQEIGFAVTDVCNARCDFCAYVPERVLNRSLTIDDVRRADWLKYSRFIAFNAGLGEPFAHPKILELLALVRELAPFAKFRTITNASLLRDKVVDVLAGWATSINISLNAATKETYEVTMHPLKWDRTIGNLRKLRDKKRELGTELPKLKASYVVHTNNLQELPRLPALLADLEIEALNINYMMPPPFSASRQLLTSEHMVFSVPDLANQSFRKTEEECRRYGIVLQKALPSRETLLGAGKGAPAPAHLPITDLSADELYLEATGEEDGIDLPVQVSPPPVGRGRAVSVSKKTRAVQAQATKVVVSERSAAASTADRPKEPRKAPTKGGAKLRARADGRPAVSHEFHLQAARGAEIACAKPWTGLSTDIFSRTFVCCSFFDRLPAFDWRSAKKFHDRDSMWNHPVMQHFRTTLNTPDEFPFCTFCKTADKRDARNAKERKKAAKASQLIVAEIEDRHLGFVRKGSLDRIEKLESWRSTRSGERPFQSERESYRYRLRRLHLVHLDRVLAFGASGPWPAFLAENNERLSLVDANPVALEQASSLLRELDLECSPVRWIDQPLPFEDGSFDAVWLNGTALSAMTRDRVLNEVNRVLKQRGRLGIYGYPGPANLVFAYAHALRKGWVERAEASLVALEKGPIFNQAPNYTTMSAIPSLLKLYGFESEKTIPPGVSRVGRGPRVVAELGRGPAEIAARLREGGAPLVASLTPESPVLAGCERSFFLSAVRTGEPKSGPTSWPSVAGAELAARERELRDRAEELARLSDEELAKRSPAIFRRGGLPRGRAGEDLPAFRSEIDGRPVFSWQASEYRFRLHALGFVGLGKVMEIGVHRGAWSAFLAENNDEMTLVDPSPGSLLRAASLLKAFGLEGHTTIVWRAREALPCDQGSYDAVWVNGGDLSRSRRGHVLWEANRVLREGGRLHVYGYPGPGGLVLSYSRALRAGDWELAEGVLRALEQGPSHDRQPNYGTLASLRELMLSYGFAIDSAVAPAVVRLGKGPAVVCELGDEPESMARRLRSAGTELLEQLAPTSEQLAGAERSHTFSALRAGSPTVDEPAAWRKPVDSSDGDLAETGATLGEADQRLELEDLESSTRAGGPAQPLFQTDREFYRQRLQRLQLIDLDRILILGGSGPWPAALAENNRRLTLIDSNSRKLSSAASLLNNFGLDNFSVHEWPCQERLPWDDGFFDAVWLEGGFLSCNHRQRVLWETNRLLRNGGRLRIEGYPGPGRLVLSYRNAVLRGDKAYSEGLLDSLESSPEEDEAPSFATSGSIEPILARFGFETDAAGPPRIVRIGSGEETCGLGAGPAEMARRLRDGGAEILEHLKPEDPVLRGAELFLRVGMVRVGRAQGAEPQWPLEDAKKAAAAALEQATRRKAATLEAMGRRSRFHPLRVLFGLGWRLQALKRAVIG